MTVTRKRLVGPTLLSNAAATIYTVPASTLTTLQHLHFSNNTGSDATLSLSIGADAAGTELFKSFNIPANTVYDYYPQRGYLNAAEVVQAFSGTSNAINVTIWGLEETLG